MGREINWSKPRLAAQKRSFTHLREADGSNPLPRGSNPLPCHAWHPLCFPCLPAEVGGGGAGVSFPCLPQRGRAGTTLGVPRERSPRWALGCWQRGTHPAPPPRARCGLGEEGRERRVGRLLLSL